MIPFPFRHIPAPYPTTCPCSSPSTGGSTTTTIIYSTFTCTISSSITTSPPISFSPPPSPAAAASSHATSPVPSTIASRMTSTAVGTLHLSDHDSEPEQEVEHFPMPVADPYSDYGPAVDLQSPSPPLPVHGQPLRGQPRG